MDWERIQTYFEADGSLRDICILGTSLADWQKIWDALRVSATSLTLTVDGEPEETPADVNCIFEFRPHRSAMISVKLQYIVLNCHFFDTENVEFDFDPEDVKGPDGAEEIERFMKFLGDLVGKSVGLTYEGWKDALIARFCPGANVVWYPAASDQ